MTTSTTKTNKYTAVNYLLYLLSKRDYSEQELRQKLKQKEYELTEIDAAIEKAQANQWQSDERFLYHFYPLSFNARHWASPFKARAKT